MRPITELIWHCTATPEGRAVTVAEIDRWHRARGWSGIGYHKVVHLDGSVSDGRPESRIGAHVGGRNTDTIGYAYVGGVAKDGRTPKDTRTPAQKATMARLTKEAIARHGLKQVSGHHDYSSKACPCFPARREYAPLLSGDDVAAPDPQDGASATALKTGTVTAELLNFRRAPNGEIVGELPEGTFVTINAQEGSWMNVTTPAGYTGWVHGGYVRAA